MPLAIKIFLSKRCAAIKAEQVNERRLVRSADGDDADRGSSRDPLPRQTNSSADLYHRLKLFTYGVLILTINAFFPQVNFLVCLFHVRAQRAAIPDFFAVPRSLLSLPQHHYPNVNEEHHKGDGSLQQHHRLPVRKYLVSLIK